MATIQTVSKTITPAVRALITAPLPVGLPPPPKGYGYEVVAGEGDTAYRTGNLIPTLRTVPTTLDIVRNAVSPLLSLTGGPTGVAGYVAEKALSEYVQSERPKFTPPTLTVRQPMAFSDGDAGYFGEDFFGGLNQALQGGLGSQLLNIGGNLAQTYLAGQYGQPQFGPPAPSQAIQTMAAVPMAARAGAVVARGFFNRFPNLAAGIQSLRNRGANVTRGSLWSMMKRFGPDFLVTGGILTAAAVSELAMAGAGRRRMNPGNVKALRRAHRRMKSFHHVCVTNDRLLGGRSRKKGLRSIGGTTITQVK